MRSLLRKLLIIVIPVIILVSVAVVLGAGEEPFGALPD